MANRKPAEVELEKLNQQQAAFLLGVTARSLRDWTDAPRSADGLYNGQKLVQWYVARVNQTEEGFDNQRERLAAAQAEKVETENRVRRGELADMAEVATVWEGQIIAAKAKLLSMPAKLGPQLVNATDAAAIAARIREEVHAALVELAAAGDVRPGAMADEGGSGMGAASEPDSLGMG
jgi:phage terminase Nu1 subunit (DNA packaging protein)